MNAPLDHVLRIYNGSDGEATRALYAQLSELGPIGDIAVNLFRAQKTSARAKVYRGGGYRGASYDRKEWSIGNLCTALAHPIAGVGKIPWGWGVDEFQPVHKHVLYVDLPTGQVSFHTSTRLEGPQYPGQWDGIKDASTDRILRWVAQLLDRATKRAEAS